MELNDLNNNLLPLGDIQSDQVFMVHEVDGETVIVPVNMDASNAAEDGSGLLGADVMADALGTNFHVNTNEVPTDRSPQSFRAF